MGSRGGGSPCCHISLTLECCQEKKSHDLGDGKKKESEKISLLILTGKIFALGERERLGVRETTVLRGRRASMIQMPTQVAVGVGGGANASLVQSGGPGGRRTGRLTLN